MILAARYLIRSSHQHLENAAVRVSDGRIDAVGPTDELRATYPDDQVEDFGLAAIMPGFVNAHSHLEYAPMEGLIEDVPYAAWKGYMVQKSALMTEEDWDDAALVGALDAIRGGITSISDVTATGAPLRACLATGMHGVVYREVTAPEKSQVPDAMAAAADDIAAWRSQAEGRGIQVGIGPDSLYSTHPEVLSAIGEFAMDGTPVAVHIAESREECDFIRYGSSPFALAAGGPEAEAYAGIQSKSFLPMGVTPVRYALNWGILYAPNVLAIHCVHVNSDDIERLASNDVRVAVCPRSNAKLGCGIAPIVKMMQAGITVGLGTSSPAAADSIDMFEEMRFGLLIERGVAGQLARVGNPDFLKGYHVMRMATIGSARAIGCADEVGSVDPGKRADLAVVDLSGSNQVPTEHPNACVVHTTTRQDLLMTMIDGKKVWTREGGFDLDLDVERLRARAKEMVARLRA